MRVIKSQVLRNIIISGKKLQLYEPVLGRYHRGDVGGNTAIPVFLRKLPYPPLIGQSQLGGWHELLKNKGRGRTAYHTRGEQALNKIRLYNNGPSDCLTQL